jgi:hypothetical protein
MSPRLDRLLQKQRQKSTSRVSDPIVAPIVAITAPMKTNAAGAARGGRRLYGKRSPANGVFRERQRGFVGPASSDHDTGFWRTQNPTICMPSALLAQTPHLSRFQLTSMFIITSCGIRAWAVSDVQSRTSSGKNADRILQVILVQVQRTGLLLGETSTKP